MQKAESTDFHFFMYLYTSFPYLQF